MIRELIAHGADVNARSNHEEWERQETAEPRDKWLPPGGLTPLLFAAREGCVECMPVLVEAGADVNATTPDGISPVVIALINGHYDVAGALVEAGTDPNLADYTGRDGAVCGDRLQHDAEVEPPGAEGAREPFDRLDVAGSLLERGADPNAQLEALAAVSRQARSRQRHDARRRHHAVPARCEGGDLPAMRLLLAHGGDPTLASARAAESTPLMAAAGFGTTEEDTTGRYKTQEQAIAAIQLLLDAGPTSTRRRECGARRCTARRCRATTTSSSSSRRAAPSSI